MGIIKIFGSKTRIPSEMFVLLFFVYMTFASVFVSIEKTYTFARAANLAMLWFFLLGVYLSMESKSPNRIMRTLTYSYLSVIFVNFAVLLTNIPSTWWGGRFKGIIVHPNSMAAICMATYPLLMLLRCNHAKMKSYLFALALTVTLLIHFLTQSRASLAFSLLGLGLYFSLSVKKKLLFLGVPLWAVGAALFAIVVYSGELPSIPRSLESYVTRGESSELMATFSGRTKVWEISLQKISERPLLGYGYDVEGQRKI